MFDVVGKQHRGPQCNQVTRRELQNRVNTNFTMLTDFRKTPEEVITYL